MKQKFGVWDQVRCHGDDKSTFCRKPFKLQQSVKFGFVLGIGFGETRDFIF